jgi:hypothetical protein
MKDASDERRDAVVGHNGGPPLDDEHVPAWGTGGIGTYFHWRRAHRRAWKAIPHATQLRRLEKAEALGLTYEEYTLEILERGRYVQADEIAYVARIKAKRREKGRDTVTGSALADAGLAPDR